MNPGPPALEASILPLSYRGGGHERMISQERMLSHERTINESMTKNKR